MPQANLPAKVTIEGARVILRNLAGAKTQYNAEGNRNFGILLSDEDAERLAADGWNVKYLSLREDDPPEATPQAWIKVKVHFGGRPPQITLISSKNRTRVTEDMVDMLDAVDIETVDVILNPYQWDVNGKTGITAYVQTMFVKIFEDELMEKYADEDSFPTRSGRVDEGDL